MIISSPRLIASASLTQEINGTEIATARITTAAIIAIKILVSFLRPENFVVAVLTVETAVCENDEGSLCFTGVLENEKKVLAFS